MAVQGKSSLLAKYGQKINNAINNHKADETVTSNFSDLPAGIDNGIAQLVECKFDVYKEGDMKGEVYFYAAGTVVQPTHVGDIPIEGLRTSIMEPVCDTPSRKRSTTDAHIAWILNQFRLLGVNTSNMNASHLEAAAEALKKLRPFFRFRTWKGKPQTTGQYAGQEPRTNHDWLGTVAYEPSSNGHESVQDQTGGDEEQSEPSAQPPASPKNRMSAPKVNGKSNKPAPAPEPEEPAFDDGALDLDALAEAAESGDKDAKIQLTELAESLGVGQEVENADDWAQAVGIIREAQGGTTQEEPAAEEGPTGLAEGEVPEKEQVWNYCPPGKNGKPGAPVGCVVMAVSTKKSTVTLKAMKGGVEYKDVPWSALITA